MAVYTHLTSEELAELIGQYDAGELVSAKGIAEGVSNSNWLIETTRDRYILTMYEDRVDERELPFFLGLLDHLAAKGSPVPRTIHDRDGAAFRTVRGKRVALIEFLPGVSIDAPTASQARAVGKALAGLHIDAQDFGSDRVNALALKDWRTLLESCGSEGLARIDERLPDLVARELDHLDAHWPRDLPRSIIHADLFPDNVLMLGNRVSGLIDFYFACTDITAYDLVVTHAAWSFDRNGEFRPGIAAGLIEGYMTSRPLAPEEVAALPILGRGAAMRFLATRAWDWLNTPPDALVTRKDPMDFARRLQFYIDRGMEAFPGLANQEAAER